MLCWRNARLSSPASKAAMAAALLALAACEKPAPNTPAPNAETDTVASSSDTAPQGPPAAPGPSLAGPLAWAASSSGEGNAIVLIEGEDTAVLRIACVRGQGLVVHGERFRHVESEERMSIGAGDTIATLVATAATDRDPPTVKGEGELDQAFINAVGAGGKIAVNYGYQNMGPFDGPPAQMAQNFVTGCKDGGG
jgi:hypothetical protein